MIVRDLVPVRSCFSRCVVAFLGFEGYRVDVNGDRRSGVVGVVDSKRDRATVCDSIEDGFGYAKDVEHVV